MKKNTLTTIAALLTAMDFADKAAIMEELNAELNKGAAEKAANAARYDAAWPSVKAALESATAPATVSEIFAECVNLPADFSKGSLTHGLNKVWTDRVEKVPGTPNTYTLKA